MTRRVENIVSRRLFFLAFSAVALARFVKFLGKFFTANSRFKCTQMGARGREHQHHWCLKIHVDLHATKKLCLVRIGCDRFDLVQFVFKRWILLKCTHATGNCVIRGRQHADDGNLLIL